MSPNPALFKQILIAAAVVSLITIWRRLSLLRLGRSADIPGTPGARFRDVLRYGFLQQRVTATAFGYNHLLLFWSFLILLLHHPMVAEIETVLTGVRPSGLLLPYPQPLLLPVMLALDLLALLGLVSAALAVARRLIAPPYPEGRNIGAFVLPALLGLIFCAYFGVNGFKINVFLSAEARELAQHWLPISSNIAIPLAGAAASGNLYELSWWLHATAVVVLLLSLPYGKLLHIVTVLPNILLRRQEQPLLPKREEFRPGNSFGVKQVDGYSWKELLDAFSCTECGRCQMACPADQSGKPLNPRTLIATLKQNLIRNGALLKQGKAAAVPLIGEGNDSVSEEAIWACTTCGACLQACPVFIEQMPKLIPLRRHLVEMEAKFPVELLNLFENMEARSNPWGIAPTERGKWASLLGERAFEPGTPEYLLYVGCAGSFDSRVKQVTVALAQLLDKAGVSWGILGKDEKCCGDSLRRLGNEYIFDKLARENVALFKERGIKKVIVQCPHCLTTLKNDYRQYGIELEVVHHSQLLLQLAMEGRLKLPKQTGGPGTLVYHDSCYLGRHNGIYDEPRKAITLATGKEPLEMPRNRENGFCCGAGGGRMWLEELTGERINLMRTAEALELKPDTICTACPYCLTMFDDGIKDLHADKVQIKDIAELMAETALH
jgi:Fe-S oxidoreductase